MPQLLGTVNVPTRLPSAKTEGSVLASRAVQKQRAAYEHFPHSKCAQAFQDIALKVDAWPLLGTPRGHMEFFVDRLVHNSRR